MSGKFTKGMPKYVMMLDGIEVEFPPSITASKDRRRSLNVRGLGQGW